MYKYSQYSRRSVVFNLTLSKYINSFLYILIRQLNEKISFWEANGAPSAREVFLILWHHKVYYRIHKSPPRVPVLSHIHQFRTLVSCLGYILIVFLLRRDLGVVFVVCWYYLYCFFLLNVSVVTSSATSKIQRSTFGRCSNNCKYVLNLIEKICW